MEEYPVYPFPFGRLMIGCDGAAVVFLRATEEPVRRGGRTPLTDLAYRQVLEYLEGRRKTFDFPYALRGTPFQRKVWRALEEIPYGETRTYRDIAAAIGSPNACRAVGMANNRNPVTLAVPCHRVIGSDGSLTGYAGGLEMKRALLALEREVLARG